jgi:hypothetical protein
MAIAAHFGRDVSAACRRHFLLRAPAGLLIRRTLMTSRRIQPWRAVIAALVVAIGVGVAWAVALLWLDTAEDSLLSSGDRVYENLYVAVDGTPVIGVESNALVNTVAVSRRTLDGKSWPVDYEYWLGSAYLGPRNLVPRLIELPLQWNEWGARMIGGTDGRRPPTAWYVVRDDKLVGHCFLAGYDAFSNLPVGYIGRNGFRMTPPATADQFALPATYERRLNYLTASSQYLRWGIVWDHQLYQEGDPAPWLVFMLEADRVWEVDLRERTSRVALESTGLISASTIRALQSTVDPLKTHGEAVKRQRSAFQLVATRMQDATLYSLHSDGAAADDEEKPKYDGALAVRTDSKILLYHAQSGNSLDFVVPKEVHNQWLRAYWIAPEQLLLQYDKGNWSGGPVQQLIWINPAGEVQRKEEVKLAGWVPPPPRKAAWKMGGGVPVPIVWLAGTVVGAPLYFVQTYRADSYADALAKVGEIAWPPLVAVIAIGVALAWLTLRLQRKYRRPATGLWTAFVVLLGVPGFVAYWLEHRRPRLQPCSECGHIVPRDRDACADCNTPFPAPRPVGTEIFA